MPLLRPIQSILYCGTTYTDEAAVRAEQIYGILPKEITSLPVKKNHPQLNIYRLLGRDEYRKFQIFLGMLQWTVTFCCPGLCNDVASLNRFGISPKENHPDFIIRIVGYLKQVNDPRIYIDHMPLIFSTTDPNFDKLTQDFFNDYPHTKVGIYTHVLPSVGPVIEPTALCDPDHDPDQDIRRPQTDYIGYVGSTPCTWGARRQYSISFSTYKSEFTALCTDREETIGLYCMLHLLC